jgi:OOP family OmpA-OmpF porin
MATPTAEMARVSWQAEAETVSEAATGTRELSPETTEYFVTAVLPGLAQGHEILTDRAAAAVPGVDPRALRRGVVRVDAGKHIWNLPGALASSLDASQQRRHALRASLCQSTPAAVADMRSTLATLHGRALTTVAPTQAFEWAGEVLHLVQDSYSGAHVERSFRPSASGPHPIRYVRYFGFISKLPPRRTTMPHEHHFPSDPRDSVFDSPGVLKREANVAIAASIEYLRMLVAQRARSRSPRDWVEFRSFLNRHFIIGSVISPGTYHPACHTTPVPHPMPGPSPAPAPSPVIPPSPGPTPLPTPPRRPPIPSRVLRRVAVLDRFAFDRSDLIPAHRRALSRLATVIVASRRTPRPVRSVVLVGYTDAAGPAAYNVGLGLRRARAAALALRTTLTRINPVVSRTLRIITRSRGETRPAASNATADGRARNRRVVVFFSASLLTR